MKTLSQRCIWNCICWDGYWSSWEPLHFVCPSPVVHWVIRYSRQQWHIETLDSDNMLMAADLVHPMKDDNLYNLCDFYQHSSFPSIWTCSDINISYKVCVRVDKALYVADISGRHTCLICLNNGLLTQRQLLWNLWGVMWDLNEAHIIALI